MMREKEARLIQAGEKRFAQRDREPHRVTLTEVRSTVESQFQQMDEAHDRIRAEELGARLAEHTND